MTSKEKLKILKVDLQQAEKAVKFALKEKIKADKAYNKFMQKSQQIGGGSRDKNWLNRLPDEILRGISNNLEPLDRLIILYEFHTNEKEAGKKAETETETDKNTLIAYILKDINNFYEFFEKYIYNKPENNELADIKNALGKELLNNINTYYINSKVLDSTDPFTKKDTVFNGLLHYINTPPLAKFYKNIILNTYPVAANNIYNENLIGYILEENNIFLLKWILNRIRRMTKKEKKNLNEVLNVVITDESIKNENSIALDIINEAISKGRWKDIPDYFNTILKWNI